MPDYHSLARDEVLALHPKVMFLTATDIETTILHENLTPLKCGKIGKCLFETHTYYTATLGRYQIIHAQCRMGNSGPGSSILTTSKAIADWQPMFIVVVGIAFGIDATKQAIGDVLVSSRVIPYDVKRISRETIEYRSAQPPSGSLLLDRFEHAVSNTISLPNGQQTTKRVGPLLSGEALIDNLEFRDNLRMRFPDAIGGDMEGAGISAAAHEHSIPWIVVKGICDFADGNKSKDKEANQKLASTASVTLCKTIFGEHNLLPGISSPVSNDFVNPELILFDYYRPDVDPYYKLRPIDSVIAAEYNSRHVWLYGGQGMGKSVTLQRLVAKTKSSNLITIDHSACVGEKPPYLLRDIARHVGVSETNLTNLDNANLIRKVGEHLTVLKSACVYIDEVPLDESTEISEYCDYIAAIIIYIKKHCKDIRIVISTHFDPLTCIKHYQLQLHENVSFHKLIEWDSDHICGLLHQVLPHLPFVLTSDQQQTLVANSSGSPRFLKNLLRENLMAFEHSYRHLATHL